MKRKIYLELISTLIIGFLIGFFVNSIVTDKRIRDFSMHQGETSFWEKALVEINATPEQKEQITPIVKEYSIKTREIVHEAWNNIPPMWDEMEKEIMLVLTSDQQERVKKMQSRRKEHFKQRMHERNSRDGKDKKDFERRKEHKKDQGRDRTDRKRINNEID